MIIRSLLVTLGAFIAWSVVIGILPEDMGWEQPIWNENTSLGQDFLYGDPLGEEDIVVLGSSLSALLPLDSITGRRVRRLALSGMGVRDGLAILESMAKGPAMVLIETNLITKAPNDEFSKALLSPVPRELGRYFPAMRQRNQPVTVLMGGLFYLKNGAPADRRPVIVPERPINQFMLDQRRAEYAEVIPADELSLSLQSLRLRLERLASRTGTKVVLFEMPVHPDLCESDRAEGIRKEIGKVFAEDDFSLFLAPDCTVYRTSDGHHLTQASAMQYARFLDGRVRSVYVDGVQ